MANSTEHTTDTLNKLLRGEISATETYQQAIARLENDSSVSELKRIHVEHRETANEIRKHVHHHGDQPDKSSGAWGAFAKMVEGTAAAFGKTAALKALKEGEEAGLSDYESALKDKQLPADCQALISSKFLPQTREHIATLDRLMAT